MIAKCPLCEGARRREIGRTGDFILCQCQKCRSNYIIRLKELEKDYDQSYFEENHSAAYGKSYIEDEENIRNFSKRRLALIRKLIPEGKTLLDAGSALGLFCDEAQRMGFRAKGAEISLYARNFAHENFGIDSYPDFTKIKDKFDCITLWFTLEHIPEPSGWLRQARALLNTGGLLALSVPNGYGAFARFNPFTYLTARPIEHHFEPSIKGMTELLRKNGFKIEKIEIFGLHPARIGFPEWDAVKYLQKFLRLGDTFEIYARKIHSSD